MATGDEFHLKEFVVLAPTEEFVAQLGPLGIALLGVVGRGFVGLTITADVVYQCALQLLGSLLRDGPITFVYVAVAHHLVEPHKGLAGLGKEHHATDGAVDAVYHTEEYLAGLFISDFDILLDVVLQPEGALGVGLHKVAGVFVHRQQMVVFVEYVVFVEHRLGCVMVWLWCVSEYECKWQQVAGLFDHRGGAGTTHNDLEVCSLAFLHIVQHLTALTTRVALPVVRHGGNGEGHDFVLGGGGLVVVEEGTLGTKTCGVDLALDVTTCYDAPTCEPCCCSNVEVGVGGDGLAASLLGSTHEFLLFGGHLLYGLVVEVVECELLFHSGYEFSSFSCCM